MASQNQNDKWIEIKNRILNQVPDRIKKREICRRNIENMSSYNRAYVETRGKVKSFFKDKQKQKGRERFR